MREYHYELLAGSGPPDLSALVEGMRELGLRLHSDASVHCHRIFLDSSDRRLAHRQYALAVEIGPHLPGRRLVLVDRTRQSELATAMVSRTPTMAGSLPSGMAWLPVAELLAGAGLTPLLRLDVELTTLAVTDAAQKTCLRLIEEHYRIIGANDNDPAPRLRLQPLRGYEDVFARVAGSIEGQLGLWPASRDLLDAALCGGGDLPPSVPCMADADEPIAWSLRRICAGLFDRLESSEAAVVSGEREALHDFRIALRTLRGLFRAFAPVVEAIGLAPMRGELRWLARRTAPVRDLDVQIGHLGRLLAGDPKLEPDDIGPFLARLAKRREKAHALLVEALASRRHEALRTAWYRWQTVPAIVPGPGYTTTARALDDAIEVCRNRLLGDLAGVAGRHPPAGRLHAVRKASKELRYLVETFAEVLPSRTSRRARRRLKRIQDVLGRCQDDAVLQSIWRRYRKRLRRRGLISSRGADRLERLIARQRRDHARAAARRLRRSRRKRLRRLLVELTTVDAAPSKALATTIVCHTFKGGSGRTVTAVNLAHVAAREGARVLLWDLDPQGSACRLYRIDPVTTAAGVVTGSDYANLDLLSLCYEAAGLDQRRRRRRLSRLLARFEGRYDYIFIDCPAGPHAWDEALLRCADIVLLPVAAEPLSVGVAERQLAQLRETVDEAVYIPYWCERADTSDHGDVAWSRSASMLESMPMTRIPWSDDVVTMAEECRPVGDIDPTSPLARAYALLWWEIRLRLSSRTEQSSPGGRGRLGP